MLRPLIRQELLVHLMSARFFAAVVITVLLVVANTFVLLGAYEERLANYSQREAVIREKIADAPTYSVLRLAVARPPNPLSLFSAGLDTRFGSSVDISHTQVPSLLSVGAPLSSKNPYLNLFSHIDLVFLFQVVLSLLALLFAYDAIAGDSEAGTLRLVLSHSVGRGAVLFAKYLAAMVCLLLPLLMSLLLVLIQCTLSRSLQLGHAEFLRIGGIVVTTFEELNVGFLFVPDAPEKWQEVFQGILEKCAVQPRRQVDYKGVTCNIVEIPGALHYGTVDDIFLLAFSEKQFQTLVDSLLAAPASGGLQQRLAANAAPPAACLQLDFGALIRATAQNNSWMPAEVVASTGQMAPLFASLIVQKETASLNLVHAPDETASEAMAKLVPFLFLTFTMNEASGQ